MNTAALEINFHSARRIERSWERVDEEASKTIAVVIPFPMRPFLYIASPVSLLANHFPGSPLLIPAQKARRRSLAAGESVRVGVETRENE